LRPELLAWFAATSLIAFALAGFDKWRAQRRGRRIRERTLLLWAAAGGSVGLALGMVLFHHKVRKTRFIVWVLAIVVLQALLLVGWWQRGWRLGT
jgi:uncharacterized membrane protein YsdA (DUF1294 family)